MPFQTWLWGQFPLYAIVPSIPPLFLLLICKNSTSQRRRQESLILFVNYLVLIFMIHFKILFYILYLLLMSIILLPIQVHLKGQLAWADIPTIQISHPCVLHWHTLNNEKLTSGLKQHIWLYHFSIYLTLNLQTTEGLVILYFQSSPVSYLRFCDPMSSVWTWINRKLLTIYRPRAGQQSYSSHLLFLLYHLFFWF